MSSSLVSKYNEFEPYQQYESIAADELANDEMLIFVLALSRNGSNPVIPIFKTQTLNLN